MRQVCCRSRALPAPHIPQGCSSEPRGASATGGVPLHVASLWRCSEAAPGLDPHLHDTKPVTSRRVYQPCTVCLFFHPKGLNLHPHVGSWPTLAQPSHPKIPRPSILPSPQPFVDTTLSGGILQVVLVFWRWGSISLPSFYRWGDCNTE